MMTKFRSEGDDPMAENQVIRIIVKNLYRPGDRPEVWEAATEDGAVLVARTKIPFCAGARALIAAGVDPDALVTMRHCGSGIDSFKPMPLRVVAKFTVSDAEGSTHLTAWKQWPDSAGTWAEKQAISGLSATQVAEIKDGRPAANGKAMEGRR